MAYNEFAYFYDEFNGEADYDALYSQIHAKLEAHGIHDGIVADLGCGTGELTLMLTQAFETRAQAENARQTREEFYRMAYSMDLSQPGSLVTLDNYIEDRLNPGIRQEAAAFVAGVRDVLNYANYLFGQNSYINPEMDRNASADLYFQAKELIPRLEQYGINANGMRMIMERHYNSLNPGQKLMEQFRK